MPPVIAHSPTDTSTRQWSRKWWSRCTFSTLHTPPSMSPMSTMPRISLMSLMGLRSKSASSRSSSRRSSVSSKDMWQPKQPASEQVAILRLLAMESHLAGLELHHRVLGDRGLIVAPLADGHLERLALHHQRAHGAMLHRLVVARHAAVGQQAGRRIDHDGGGDPPPRHREDILLVHAAA